MSFQGDIASIALGDVFQNLAANGKTGTLAISGAAGPCRVRFEGGKITSCGDIAGLPVLDWLVEKGIVPAERKDEAARRLAKAKKKTLGEILRDMGLLDEEGYRTYVEDLVKDSLYEALSRTEGGFEFREGEAGEAEPDRDVAALGLTLNPVSVVMEAARRADDWQKIRRHIPSESDIYLVPAGERQRRAAETEDEAVREAIALLDGTRPLRKVIARLPCSRFDACRILADLIAAKVARPLGADHLARDAAPPADRRQAIDCLKAVLEREPNNREVLSRLAELHAAEGERDEAATCVKLLAISHLEEDNLPGAEECLRRSLALNPGDIVTWQKLRDTVVRQGDAAGIETFGNEFTEHFRKLGLMEIVRDHLAGMVRLFPQALRPRVELAEARFALGDRRGGLGGLFDVADELMRRNRLDDADKVFSRILRLDRENVRARELHEKIRSGKLAASRARRRRAARLAAVSLLFLALCGYLGNELYVRGELLLSTKSVFADCLLENGRHDEAIRRIESVRDAHPFSVAGRWEVPQILKALRASAPRPLPKAVPASTDASAKAAAPAPPAGPRMK